MNLFYSREAKTVENPSSETIAEAVIKMHISQTLMFGEGDFSQNFMAVFHDKDGSFTLQDDRISSRYAFKTLDAGLAINVLKAYSVGSADYQTMVVWDQLS